MTSINDLSVNKVSREHLDIIMHGRRSLFPKQFTGEIIDDEVIVQLLQYANTAPNHKKTMPWRFVIFSGQALSELVDFMQEYYLVHTPGNEISQKKLEAFKERKEKVSHIVAIIMHRDELQRVPEMEEIAAVSCAVQNIYLSLNSFGLGGYWSTGNLTFSSEVRDFLEIKGEDRFMGFFFLGKVNMEFPIPQRDNVESRIVWKK